MWEKVPAFIQPSTIVEESWEAPLLPSLCFCSAFCRSQVLSQDRPTLGTTHIRVHLQRDPRAVQVTGSLWPWLMVLRIAQLSFFSLNPSPCTWTDNSSSPLLHPRAKFPLTCFPSCDLASQCTSGDALRFQEAQKWPANAFTCHTTRASSREDESSSQKGEDCRRSHGNWQALLLLD